MYSILLLEDDLSLIEGLSYSLHKNGYELDIAESVAEAEQKIEANSYSLLLLDITLPDGNGIDLCEKIRKTGNRVPVIFLTALDEEIHVIRGLDCGGDDYITKPFKIGELCSRINALLRRSEGAVKQETVSVDAAAVLEGGDIRVELDSCAVWCGQNKVELTGIEYKLLCLFLNNKGQLLTREKILDFLWDGNGNFVDDNTLSVHIRRLREKIETDPSHPVHLLTVRGFGYRFAE
ncbi:MAG: response regulator transcription factor [Lachnospiraceae bacterium]|nr:response regulator transcription factor [Lachnospiraceae bacterium]